MSIERTDPPYAADEITMLRAWLDFYRATLLRQVEGLDADQWRATLPPSSMTLAGMVKHLAGVEDWWLSMVLLGNGPGPASADEDPDDVDWDWHTALADPPEQLVELFRESVRLSEANLDAALADGGGLDRLAARPRSDGSGTRASLRWILVHLVEEYARHAGHADLIRESIDGRTDL